MKFTYPFSGQRLALISTCFLLLFTFFTPSLVVAQESKASIYDYIVTDIDGELFPMESLRGKKLMIVNVASKCGLTSQYETLEEVYKAYKDQNFEIIAFPSNDFMGQEPGSNEDIKEFCSLNYGVSFRMMAKISVKGDEKAPIYRWLTTKELNGVDDYTVKWNFQKFLINPDGTLYDVLSPITSADSSEVIEWITGVKTEGE